MKKILLSALAFSFLSINSYAQGEMDALKLSRNDLKGTARSVGMGGAFGALGGDASGVAINPAGIGVYKSSEFSGTLNFSNTDTKTEMNAGELKESKFKVNFDNFSYVGAFPLGSDDVPFLNVGFAYNKLKSFDRKYSMRGDNLNSSLSDYMAYRADGYSSSSMAMWDENNKPLYPFDDRNGDWLAILGYNSWLIDPASGTNKWQSVLGAPGSGRNTVNTDMFVREKGSVNNYDFNIGTTISNILSIGATVSVTDIDYHMFSEYEESFKEGEANRYFNMANWLKTEGTGYQLKAGFILKPVDEFRIGVAYHSPTWYNMTDFYEADLIQNMTGEKQGINTYNEAGDTYVDYRLRTPDKWVFSLASVIAKTAIISVDYELTNYGNMNLKDDYGNSLSNNPLADPNTHIKSHYKNSSTLRAGLEVRFTPQFSARVGYAWMQSPLEKDFKANDLEVMTVGTVPHYTLDGDINNFTYGLGYRFTRNFYADVAFVLKSQKDDLYAFSTITDNAGRKVRADKSTLKTDTFQGLLTLGYRF